VSLWLIKPHVGVMIPQVSQDIDWLAAWVARDDQASRSPETMAHLSRADLGHALRQGVDHDLSLLLTTHSTALHDLSSVLTFGWNGERLSSARYACSDKSRCALLTPLKRRGQLSLGPDKRHPCATLRRQDGTARR
jgi:hypothetical protein